MSIYDHFSDKERETLRARAERAARPLQTDRPDDRLDALVVTIRAETVALPVETVLAVYEAVPIIPLPCTPPFIAGIANIRGHILPVLDLGALLEAGSQSAGDTAALVVVSSGELSVAFRVEQIGAVQAMTTTSPLPPNLDLGHSEYLEGILPDGTVLLDVKAILSDPALVVNDTVG